MNPSVSTKKTKDAAKTSLRVGAKPAKRMPDMEMCTGPGSHTALRLWLRLLTTTQLVQTELRRRLRAEFGTTLPRFDLMAQLARHPDGLRMTELSRRLMVTGGNVTGIADQLEKEGLVGRDASPDDRRSITVRLTPAGRALFERMAAAHERWVVELLGGLASDDKARLHEPLGRLKQHLHERLEDESHRPAADAPSIRQRHTGERP
ncbi:MarR family transcriptional regulator [Burkholderia sp. WAC0059]|uniref:MarR family winged helix-turn-helix transcriptional regulator n=1 Tax=Burkholderia sp. WAC0059 TaxID=2066022 RepID=UPI000C7F13E5|nr:MarR family transcriptional regulator [Burkholderia sp. WAC0059]PLZ03942.1 MarR family transcriptional regulator [Burkholderia sp. WAC0059]